MFDVIDELAVNSIRLLSIEAVEKANSGHPGLPLGAAPMAYVLWKNHLKINPENSKWFNRDRFVLSAGHGSAMLYSLLHLSGFKVSIDDLKKFRQYGSNTPGHPEFNVTDGVDASTGPLGQGIATAVGMAMAEAHLASFFNQKNLNIIDHFTYVLCGDGDLQEGISYEACSIAGHLKLGKLIMLYDSNDSQLDGSTKLAFSEDIKSRFESEGWDYTLVEDGTNLILINEAISKAKEVKNKPSIIEVRTEIGYGSKYSGSSVVHGSPLGREEIENVKKSFSWKEKTFEVPKLVYDRFRESILLKGIDAESKWIMEVEYFKNNYEDLGNELKKIILDNIEIKHDLPKFTKTDNEVATRSASGNLINNIAQNNLLFWGGSADLSSSNKTNIVGGENFSSDNYSGKNISYGVREHAMGAIMNGILLHGGTKTFTSTYLVFSDYMRPAIRMAAISQIPGIFIFTHDSIAVGEDGPTHQPVEQLNSFRGMPNLTVLRPADANETIESWEIALKSKKTPTLIVLSRQNLPVLTFMGNNENGTVSKGAFVLSAAKEQSEGLLIASGSEVHLALEAQKELERLEHYVSVISVPSLELFSKQSDEYKESVLPKKINKRVVIEMGSPHLWESIAGNKGKIIGINDFGESGAMKDIVRKFGFTVENIVNEYVSFFD